MTTLLSDPAFIILIGLAVVAIVTAIFIRFIQRATSCDDEEEPGQYTEIEYSEWPYWDNYI